MFLVNNQIFWNIIMTTLLRHPVFNSLIADHPLPHHALSPSNHLSSVNRLLWISYNTMQMEFLHRLCFMSSGLSHSATYLFIVLKASLIWHDSMKHYLGTCQRHLFEYLMPVSMRRRLVFGKQVDYHFYCESPLEWVLWRQGWTWQEESLQ